MTSLDQRARPGRDGRREADGPPRGAVVEIVVPVRDEERDLAPSVRRLHGYLRSAGPEGRPPVSPRETLPVSCLITIADNGSTDRTWAVAVGLERELTGVRAVRIESPGRGGALRTIWSASDAEIYAYMDVDLSTGLNALLPLLAPLLTGHSDLAIGTRLARGARVARGPRRELLSRGYNALLHVTLGTGFTDAQCGFKAIRADAARRLLPLTTDRGWFFDTELLVLAERAGLRIHEVPVDWIDDPDSRVRVLPTIAADLRGIARLGTGLARGSIRVPRLASATPGDPARAGVLGQLAGFVVVGAASTIACIALFLLLRGPLGAQPANAVSLLATTIGNTAANRRFTFGIRGRAHATRDQLRGLIAFGVGLAVTSGALAWLHAADPSPGRGAEVAVLVAASLTGTVVRFALFRGWVFGAAGRSL